MVSKLSPVAVKGKAVNPGVESGQPISGLLSDS